MTYALGTAKEAFDLILSIGAGTGLLYLLRWFWWRVSAWSEIAAMAELVRRRARLLHRPQERRSSSRRTCRSSSPSAVTTVVWVATTLPRAADRRGDAREVLHARAAVGAGLDADRASAPACSGIARTRCRRRCSAGCSAAPSSTRRCSARAACCTDACRSSGRGSSCCVASGIGMARVLRGFWATSEPKRAP